MKTKQDIRKIIEKKHHLHPLIQIMGIDFFISNYKLHREEITESTIQKIINKENILSLLEMNSKKEGSAIWAKYVAEPLLKKYPDNEQILDVVLKALLEGIKIDFYGWLSTLGNYLAAKYLNNPKVFNILLQMPLIGLKLKKESYDAEASLCNFFITKFTYSKQVIDVVYQVLQNAIKNDVIKNQEIRFWIEWVVEPFSESLASYEQINKIKKIYNL